MLKFMFRNTKDNMDIGVGYSIVRHIQIHFGLAIQNLNAYLVSVNHN